MKFIIKTLLFILIAYGESFENPLKDVEMYKCYIKLICELDKIEEFYDITKSAGPELATKYIALHEQIFGVKDPEDTLEHWIHFKDIVCAMPEEQRQKGFNEWCASVGEHMLEICTDPLSELCQKAEIAADQFAVLLAEYEATGVCAELPEGVPEGMMPGGMGKMPSSPFG